MGFLIFILGFTLGFALGFFVVVSAYKDKLLEIKSELMAIKNEFESEL